MKLDTWLTSNFMTTQMFADQLAELTGNPIGVGTAEAWRRGRSMPRYHMLKPIAELTKGKVKPNDLVVRARPKPKPYKKAQL